MILNDFISVALNSSRNYILLPFDRMSAGRESEFGSENWQMRLKWMYSTLSIHFKSSQVISNNFRPSNTTPPLLIMIITVSLWNIKLQKWPLALRTAYTGPSGMLHGTLWVFQGVSKAYTDTNRNMRHFFATVQIMVNFSNSIRSHKSQTSTFNIYIFLLGVKAYVKCIV